MNTTDELERDHTALYELLPLAAAGALSARERAIVDAHVTQCAVCRAELALLGSFDERFDAADAALPPSAERASLDRVWKRVQAERARVNAPAWWQRALRAWKDWPSAARWAVAGQGMALAGLALVVGLLVAGAGSRSGTFESAAGPAGTSVPGGARVRIAWRDDANAAAVRGLLASLHAQVVAGPSAAGFYTLEFSRDAGADALQRLRSRSDLVQWAEPQ